MGTRGTKKCGKKKAGKNTKTGNKIRHDKRGEFL